MDNLQQLLPLLIPILIIQLALAIFALVDLSKRAKTRYLPKWAWVLIIVLGEMIGPVVYFLVAREDE